MAPRRRFATACLLVAAAGAGACLPAAPPPGPAAAERAVGHVYHDRNGNGVRDRFDFGIGGVAVSNGRDVVRTDWRGRYALPVDGDTTIFVIKPRGFATPVDPQGLPRFYYHHRPHGSPAGRRFGGIPASGPLPAAIDFPLTRQREPSRFEVLLFGDPQPYSEAQVDLLARDVVADLVGSHAAFGITLGDVVGDDLSLYEPLNGVIGRIGIPWYNVPGNHDVNYDAPSDATSLETFAAVYGPTTYAFQYASAHFVVLDDVVYGGELPGGASVRNYVGGLRADQLAFLRAYLRDVPRDELVVIAMHIPLSGPAPTLEVPQRRELFAILADHPHNFSVAAHTHTQEHRFFGPDDGYPGPGTHHHLVQGTTSGSWWLGVADEEGIPHAMMRDGTPNGYSVLTVDGNRYAVRYRVARRPASYQMRIHAPSSVSASDPQPGELSVNVFAGSERTIVEMRVDGAGPWTRLTRVAAPAPAFVALKRREAASVRPPATPLPPADASSHLWRGALPAGLAAGVHTLDVRATDMYGQVDRATHLLRVE